MNNAIKTMTKPNKQRMKKETKVQYRNRSNLFF
jgi:hypothetical protein